MSMETDDLRAKPSGPQIVQPQESVAGELPKSIKNMFCEALSRGNEVLGDVSEGENYRNQSF